VTGTRAAVVTGASRGIGRAVAEKLAGEGVAVAITYAASPAAANAAAQAIRQAGGTAVAISADVSDADQVRALFDRAEAELGGIDIVVAAAGMIRPVTLAEATDQDFSDHIEVNLRGTFSALREAARRIRDGGRIITFSSTTLALNPPGYGLYNATKAAAEGLTKVLAKELGGRGVTVNAIAPGPVATELFMTGKTSDEVAQAAGRVPQNRIGQPIDIADAVALLVSPGVAWINGQTIRVNGGLA